MGNKTNEKVMAIVSLSAAGALFLLTTLLLFFCPIGDETASWYLANSQGDGEYFIGLIGLLLFFVCLVITALSVVNYFVFKKKIFARLKIGALINFIVAALVCVAATIIGLELFPFLFLGIGIVLFLVVCIFATESEKYGKTETGGTQSPVSIKEIKANVAASGQTFLSIVFVFAALLLLFINSCVLTGMPLFADVQSGTNPSFAAIFSDLIDFPVVDRIFCIMFILLLAGNCVFLIHTVLRFFSGTLRFLRTGKAFAFYNIGMALFCMLYSVIKMFVSKFTDGDVFFITFINVLTAYAFYALFIVFAGRAKEEERAKRERTAVRRTPRNGNAWPLVFLSAMTALTFCMLFVNLFTLTVDAPTGNLLQSVSGFDILRGATTYSGFQNAVAFILLICVILSTLFLIFTVLNFLIDADNYRQSAIQFAYANLIFQFFYLAMGLFYVLMVPSFDSLLALVFGDLSEILFGADLKISDYVKAKTLAYIPFIIGFAILVSMQMVLSLHKKAAVSEGAAEQKSGEVKLNENRAALAGAPPAGQAEAGDPLFDPCPAFTELDRQLPQYRREIAARRNQAFENPTLQRITQFVVHFAKNTPERLSYSDDTVATFIAGLGASRLSILQGMSGTGKTSLPKVFMQAILGNCDLVEVESSWRDKNELLGYYNEFNGVYAPKKFTQYLYKAAMNVAVPTFIVLDEMNLSRIEYYFSDFLSVMESREGQRAVCLLNTRIYPPAAGEQSEQPAANRYLALENGNTLKVPPNVWFIGTANRDESTFEISDKVYDRAQTINFDRRAPKINEKRVEVPPRFIEYNQLAALFDEAKRLDFNAEADPLIASVEKILAPYKVSFGNRILMQIEDFVKIYIACFAPATAEAYRQILHRAIENIMFSKVLRKLELKIVENRAQLAQSFDKLNFRMCAEFVRHLEDN